MQIVGTSSTSVQIECNNFRFPVDLEGEVGDWRIDIYKIMSSLLLLI